MTVGSRLVPLGRSVRGGLRIPAWIYLYLTAALAGWVVIIWVATAWQPTVVTSGSMTPAIRTGDVVFLSTTSIDSVAERSIVTFETANGQTVLHRVFSIEDGHYTTKGDANSTPDPERLDRTEIKGVGKLVVPIIGLPVVWWANGQYVPFGAWIGLSALALLYVVNHHHKESSGRAEIRARAPVAQMAIRQVRVLVIFMVIAQYLIDPIRFAVAGSSFPPFATLGLIILVLSITNLLSSRAQRIGDEEVMTRASVYGICFDMVLVVLTVTATGSSGIGWILFALPIVEAAARSRLVGALAAWMALTGSTIGLRIWMANRSGTASAVLLDDLDAVADQLSVLLLLVVPAAYLAEQLLHDVLELRTATSEAEDRSDLLQQVVELGRRVTQLDHSLFETLVEAIHSLGFDGADVVAGPDSGAGWQVLAESGWFQDRPIPPPGALGSGLRPSDIELSSIYIDATDAEDEDASALERSGWGTLVRLTVATNDGAVVVVRATLERGRSLDPDAVDGLTLLLGQASIGLQNNQLLDELWSLSEMMLHGSTHDSLTGLPNRVELLVELGEALAEVKPADGLAVLFLDLNGFKPVNDRLGHDAGDQLLQIVAERLQNRVGDGHFVARLGGDEFTVMAKHLDSARDAEAVAERLAAAIDEPFIIGSDPVRISTAIGISYTDQPIDPPELIRRADVAMYQAKGDTVRPFRHYKAEMDEADIRLAILSDDFATALQSDEIQMYFQPMVQRVTGAIVGVESLVRWTHPRFGPVDPPDLVAMAESSGRAAQMNRWILNQSMQGAKRLMAQADFGGFFVSVNATPTEVRLPTFVDHVVHAASAADLKPHNVLIELSEKLVLDEDPVITENLRLLEEIGIKVLLDDFGEGKTTLAHLRRLPLAGLKLDRAFLMNIEEQPEDEIIVRSMVTMAHELGIYVIAEGVESGTHVEVAERTGIDFLQGYHFGHPMPLQDALRLLETIPRGAAHMIPATTSKWTT